ncbi:DoxX family protein [Candidatus Rariloculus sp.]|uniref:DoxX family protein n=1 Tax=Candidatus Rariloculus sp. TaxID=3101265 RepID=UPI003D0BAFEE
MTSVATAYLIARVLTCGIWVAAGLYKATHFEHTVKEMQGHGIPLARVALPIVIALEMVGSLMLIVDYYVWAVCVAWLVFLVPASYLYHFRYMVKNSTIDFLQWVLFWKNVSIAGGLIALILLDASAPGWLIAAA